MRLPTAMLPIGTCVILAVAAWSVNGDAAPVDFSREIQPLLAKRCFACHGPDTHEAGLRLDQQAAAFAKLESGGHAIVPRESGASEILARITSNDPDTQMPPEGPRLTATQVDAITRWIDEGAEWKELIRVGWSEWDESKGVERKGPSGRGRSRCADPRELRGMELIRVG